MKRDVSILIVHYNTPGLLRQTLRGITKANPSVSYEVIVVDNNPMQRIGEMVRKEFPGVKLVRSEENIGFGRGMNAAMQIASGRYYLVFNPDILLSEGALEKMVAHMDAHSDVGMLGPRLNNPDGSLQHSAYTFMKPEVIAYRRVPLIGRFGFAKKAIDSYLRVDADHAQVQPVDYVLGAAMFVRKQVVDQVGGFDPEFFVYFEDQDWCRRFWAAGWKVLYFPKVSLIHYHRRETAKGGFLKQLFNPLTRIQIKSALYYYKKYRDQ
ncbi:MAG: glycosyltransferase family 2 protein [bacterium]|jgi:GT2 family glycosyltransferase|nr:glycosyltransferase family 2 protein [bacterium]